MEGMVCLIKHCYMLGTGNVSSMFSLKIAECRAGYILDPGFFFHTYFSFFFFFNFELWGIKTFFHFYALDC